MAHELGYAILTPYSLSKSRTGGILARLISRTGLELVGARMFAPGIELVRQYAEMLVTANDPQDRRIQELIRGYILKNFVPDSRTGRRRRVMLLVFRGEDAVRRVRSVVGNFSLDRMGGETIRDTYGDLVFDDHNQVIYFEPAVLAAPDATEAQQKLKLWARYSDTDGGLLQGVIPYPEGAQVQRTLVLIKPDNFRFPTGRPGNVIDFFSRTGLFIIGIKVHRMSVAEAEEFYAPVREVLRTRLTDVVATRAKAALEPELQFEIPPAETRRLGEILSPLHADWQFENIVKFMSGHSPHTCADEDRTKPGTEKCIALVYEGPDAVRKIREVLGPTDPSKAPPGSIRREFGQTVMVNAAHASDSEENARRELKIIGFDHNHFREDIEAHFGGL
ncbi:MAG TPA: nucleoside-diphosphate kinase [Candidatus Paceibacterota bacterium]|nr:nucleoside-diphosphate kinase [Verrucomicrobiota bacterium]HOX02883.1 nucleoside-diphosphate kinase [Verrucomicrobiota bacterium]HRZ45635.1 nucleoside-diphosphate kinase [Candidatus Paceibacterota bacterium]HRZ93175.1 nucleoside-diphosphate kinase [Candidatus Paceibacterota bacterium]